jgi:arsenate reductase
MNHSLGRRALAEFIGTGFLLAAIVGSGIAAQRLAPQSPAAQLSINAVVTGLALAAAIVAVGPVSGAHLNPLVSVVDRFSGGLSSSAETAVYAAAQTAGAISGVVVANLMFSLPVVSFSSHARDGGGVLLGEIVGTLGLLLLVFSLAARNRPNLAPFAIGGYITAGILFTSSASFANPAVTIAREFSNTFTGISPASVPGFIAAQVLGAAFALVALKALFPGIGRSAAVRVVVRHEQDDGRVENA